MNDKKLTKLPTRLSKSKKELSDIVRGMDLDLGLLIYPGSRVFDVVSENGDVVERHIALLLFLELLNNCGKAKKVLLPAWAPDFLDERFKNLVIERTKINNLKASELIRYDFIGTTEGSYAFTNFTLHFDSLFASMKLIEMLSLQAKKIGELYASFPPFYYHESRVPCPNSQKGKMMRKFLEDSVGKEASHVDGVKIWVSQKAWVLMIPDQNNDNLRLYVQAESKTAGEKILKEYIKKIELWIDE